MSLSKYSGCLPAGEEDEQMGWLEPRDTEAARARRRHERFLETPSLIRLWRPKDMTRSNSLLWEEMERILRKMCLHESSQESFTLRGRDRDLLEEIRSEEDKNKILPRLQEEVQEWGFLSYDAEAHLDSKRDTAVLIGAPTGWGVVFLLNCFDNSIEKALCGTVEGLLRSEEIATLGFDLHKDCCHGGVVMAHPIDMRGLLSEWKENNFVTMEDPDDGDAKLGLKEAAFLLWQQSHAVFFPYPRRKVLKVLRRHYNRYGELRKATKVPESRDATRIYDILRNLTSAQRRYLYRDLATPIAVLLRQLQRMLAERAGEEVDRRSLIREALFFAERCPIPAVVQKNNPWRFHIPAPWPPLNRPTEEEVQVEEKSEKKLQEVEERIQRRKGGQEDEFKPRFCRGLQSFRDSPAAGAEKTLERRPLKRKRSETPERRRSSSNFHDDKRQRRMDSGLAQVLHVAPKITKTLKRFLGKCRPYAEDPFPGLCNMCGRHPDDKICRARFVPVCAYTEECEKKADHGLTMCKVLQGLCRTCGKRGHASLDIDCLDEDKRKKYDNLFNAHWRNGVATRYGDKVPNWSLQPPPRMGNEARRDALNC